MPRGVPPPPEDRVRREDVAFLFPFFGIIVLMPPILNLFVIDRLVFGVPLEVVYLFAVWIALILGAVILGRRSLFQTSERDVRAEGGRARQDRSPRDV